MRIRVTFSESEQRFGVIFGETEERLGADFGAVQKVTEYVGGEPYKGDYEVTPKITEQVMATKNKVMTQDTTIRAIPYFETGNNSGGNTVYIGREV